MGLGGCGTPSPAGLCDGSAVGTCNVLQRSFMLFMLRLERPN